MIAVVTGSSGFIGSHLVRALLAEGATVRALLRPQSTVLIRDARIEYHEVDLLNAQAVHESSVWNSATHVFHVAGRTVANNAEQFQQGNVQPVANIVGALVNRTVPPHLILVSSQAAAGPASRRDAPLRETDAPSPFEPYGRSKREAERVVEAVAERMPVTIVRPPAVYGPGDRDFLEAFRQALSLVALHASAPLGWFDILHVDDVVGALLLVAHSPSAYGRTYFLSHDEPLRWRDLYELVAAGAAGADSPLPVRHLQVPGFLMQGAAMVGDAVGLVTGRTPLLNSQKLMMSRPMFWLCNSQRIREELQWKPLVAPHEGVRKTYLWYVDAGWLSRKHPVTRTL
ncbi:MAG: NAD-dependent epimerase/dehydratase family protein [Gemmatimonas sp.]